MPCRAKSIALVCKAWNKADRLNPEQPTQLTVRRQSCNSSYLTWHLRSSQKLVELTFCAFNDDSMKMYPWVFSHLSNQAPALRVLKFSPPHLSAEF